MKSKKSLSLSLSRQEKEEIRKKNKKHIFVTGEREEIKKKKWLVLIHISIHERKEKGRELFESIMQMSLHP
jgi:hypothetical protein